MRPCIRDARWGSPSARPSSPPRSGSGRRPRPRRTSRAIRTGRRVPCPSRRRTSGTSGSTRCRSGPNSATLIASMGTSKALHPDFGSFAGYGIPVNLVSASTPRSTVGFQWPGESDQVGYPIPASPLIEGAGAPGDRHILMVDTERLPAVGAVRGEPRRAATGRPAPGRPGTSARTRSAPTAGRPPTPRACRSTRASRATTRSRPGRSPTRCGSRCRRRGRPTSTRPATTRAPARARRCRRWACASG